MALTQQEQDIVLFGKQNGKSLEEVTTALSKFRIEQQKVNLNMDASTPKESTYLSRVGEGFKEGAEKVKQAIKSGADAVGDTDKSILERTAKVGETILNTAGAVASTAFTPVTAALEPALEPVIEKIATIPGVAENLEKVTEWAKTHPQAATDLQSVFDIATLGVGGAGEKVAKDVAVKVGEKTAQVATDVAKSTREAVATTAMKVADATQGARDVGGMIIENASRIPSKISTNVAEKQAVRNTIKELPTKTAQRAAQDGIDVPDIKFIYNVPATERPMFRKLADTVKSFANGTSKINPIEIVGKPIVGRIKQLTTEQSKIGQALGEAAKNLGVVTKQEVAQPVFDALKRVPGLDGLTVKNGLLNFKNTVLTTIETKADRKAIQSIFQQATKWGNGEAKHKLRQELFEILGGKKKSLQNITGTQEKAYQAVRKALADVLDAKNPTYKELNAQFAKVAQPLQNMSKFMKGIGAEEDIANMSAGLLARRLTSNAISNPQIRSILRELDNAIPAKGSSALSTERLQDFYNILNKYYDIAGKTGFQGQVKAGIESSTGVVDAISRAVQGFAGETSAVRQKALEKVLDEVLKVSFTKSS